MLNIPVAPFLLFGTIKQNTKKGKHGLHIWILKGVPKWFFLKKQTKSEDPQGSKKSSWWLQTDDQNIVPFLHASMSVVCKNASIGHQLCGRSLHLNFLD